MIPDRLRPPLTCRADQLRGRVDAGDLGALLVEQPAQHALTAGYVEDALAGLDVQQAQHAGVDDFAVVFTALVADKPVIPLGHPTPVGARAGGRAARTGRRVVPAVVFGVWSRG